MKGSRFLSASMAAFAATAAVSTVSFHSPAFTFNCNFNLCFHPQEAGCHRDVQNFSLQSDDASDSSSQPSPPSDKFAPRFDGMRFIETLITAHR